MEEQTRENLIDILNSSREFVNTTVAFTVSGLFGAQMSILDDIANQARGLENSYLVGTTIGVIGLELLRRNTEYFKKEIPNQIGFYATAASFYMGYNIFS